LLLWLPVVASGMSRLCTQAPSRNRTSICCWTHQHCSGTMEDRWL